MAITDRHALKNGGGRMSQTTKMVIALAGIFAICEISTRWLVRRLVDQENAIHLFGGTYLANVINPNATMAFGLTTIAWLGIALSISLLFFLIFYIAERILPEIDKGWLFVSGYAGSALLISVVAVNTLEAATLGGVSDYIAFVNKENKSAFVINIGDLVLAASLLVIPVAFLGVFISAIGFAGSSSKAN